MYTLENTRLGLRHMFQFAVLYYFQKVFFWFIRNIYTNIKRFIYFNKPERSYKPEDFAVYVLATGEGQFWDCHPVPFQP